MITQYIPLIIKDVVTKVSAELKADPSDPEKVFFDFGHYSEVDKNLKQKDGSLTSKGKKFPLIWLVMDFEETMGANPADYAQLNNVRIVIANTTKPEWDMTERMNNNYLPVLYPIYAELIKQFSESVEFGMPSQLQLSHTKIDRPFWGSMPEGNMFSNHIDAIELKNLKLKVKHKIC